MLEIIIFLYRIHCHYLDFHPIPSSAPIARFLSILCLGNHSRGICPLTCGLVCPAIGVAPDHFMGTIDRKSRSHHLRSYPAQNGWETN